MSRSLGVLALSAGLLAIAPAASAQTGCENVCDQQYALCIAATCVPCASGTKAACICDVQTGWSIGPVGCAQRAPVQKGDTTHLVSTFSTALYATDSFQQLTGSSADCYGAPCVSWDGEVAICYCDMGSGGASGTFWTEAGGCAPPLAGLVFSGASCPFAGGGLAELAQTIAKCSGTSAPAPTGCTASSCGSASAPGDR